MWTCPYCNQQFLKTNQTHSCRDKTLDDFFKGKSEGVRALFDAFVYACNQVGAVTIHPTRSMIAFAARKRMGYITRVGKDFIDVSFMFNERYDDNLCFYRIGQVPGTAQYNHYFRMYREEDINEEVMTFLKILYQYHNT